MSRQPFSLTFRGRPVRDFYSNRIFKTTSIYDGLHVLLSYKKYPDGSVAMDPKVTASFKTAESCFRRLTETPSLREWEGQSFVVKVGPGVTEVVQAEVVEKRKARA